LIKVPVSVVAQNALSVQLQTAAIND